MAEMFGQEAWQNYAKLVQDGQMPPIGQHRESYKISGGYYLASYTKKEEKKNPVMSKLTHPPRLKNIFVLQTSLWSVVLALLKFSVT